MLDEAETKNISLTTLIKDYGLFNLYDGIYLNFGCDQGSELIVFA